MTSAMPEPHISIAASGMADCVPAEWNALCNTSQPFISHEFLLAMETSGSVAHSTGWEPCHLLARDNGALAGALPLYRKYHSFGEFVFDWAWADACQRAGIAYYPKLLTASPYSPVTGQRLLGKHAEALIETGKAEAERSGHVSWHVLFPKVSELETWQEAGFLIREDCQFQWFDAGEEGGYGDFEGFLAALKSKRRKEIRRERRQVDESGLKMETVTGKNMTAADLDAIYRCYATAYAIRGQAPYLTYEFFRLFAAAHPELLVVFAARHGDEIIAAAICLRDDEALYGRHWGSRVDVPGLHFEACYYQGIEYCLEHGLNRFEPGTQGEHKISRGFEPVPVYSAHWLRHPGLRDTIQDFLARETPMIRRYRQDARALLPFRQETR